MNAALTITVTLAMVLPVFSQGRKPDEAQVAIEKMQAQIKATGEKLATVDASDKAITLSNQAQIDTTAMVGRLETKILRTDIPKAQEKLKAWEVKRQRYIDSGCPPEGGTMPPPIAERCNRERIPLNSEHDAILLEFKSLEDQLTTIAKTRQEVSATTLANVRKQKDNVALREQLEAAKVEQEAQIRKLYIRRITEAISKLEMKAVAEKACQAITNLEEAACCHEVVWDGRNPAQCNVPLIYDLFGRGGVFPNQ